MSLPVALLSNRQDGRNNLVGSAALARWLGVTDKTIRGATPAKSRRRTAAGGRTYRCVKYLIAHKIVAGRQSR
jgi:hypothetical protein